MPIKKEILKILELKNEQSYYQKQRQDRKILNFLKSMPLGVLQEFNMHQTNTFVGSSLSILYLSSKKYLKLIKYFYKNTDQKLNKNLYDANADSMVLYLFSFLISGMIKIDEELDKLWEIQRDAESEKKIDYQKISTFNTDEYNINKMKIEFLSNINDFNYNLFSKKNNHNLKDFLLLIDELNEYDYIFIINNFFTNHQILETMSSYFTEDENNIIKEYKIDILCKEEGLSYISDNYNLTIKQYRSLKSDCNNLEELESTIDNLKKIMLEKHLNMQEAYKMASNKGL